MSDEQMVFAAKAFFDEVKTRHTVRGYTNRPVPQTVIEDCVRTAGRTPCGANHQLWHFVAIKDPAFMARIRKTEEEEEVEFCAGGGDEWIKVLELIGTGPNKPRS